MESNIGLSKRISTPGPSANVWYGPWNSIEEYLETRRTEYSEIPLHSTILVKQADGSYKLMRNDKTETQFKLIENQGTYIIEPQDWNITEGYISKNGHYTSSQYEQMRQNCLSISQAIKFAEEAGFSRVGLKKGIYCFCTREYYPTYKGGALPAINLVDLSNIEIDLGGSELHLLIDSLECSPYVHDKNSQTPWMQGGLLMQLSYCNHVGIKNGKFIGDRFIRDYVYSESTAQSMYSLESANESTYGIMIGGGNNNISIVDCSFIGFMGDGISGQPTSYFYTSVAKDGDYDNLDEGCRTSMNTIQNNDTLRGWDSYPENTYKGNQGKAVQQSKNEQTTITPLYRINQGNQKEALIDVDKLYTQHLDLKNRKAYKDSRTFMVTSTGGYNRTPGCYPGCIGILTYDTLENDPQPLRYIEVGYMDRFTLSPTEKYLRLQYFHEDHCAEEYRTDKTYSNGNIVIRKVQNPMFLYKCIKNMTTSGDFNENYWQKIEYTPSVSTPTYDNTKVYGVGEEVYYYPLLTYTPKTNGQGGTWNSENWDILPCINPGESVNYNPGQTYNTGARVTNIATEIFVPYKAKITTTGEFDQSKWELMWTDKPWFPSVNPLVAISEAHSVGVEILRCEFIDSNRGNVSNMPGDTVIKESLFRKYLHTPGDGFNAPNFCGTMAGSLGETTNYSIDLEDYISSSFKLYDCRFESSDLNTGKVLLNTLNHVISGCSGQMLLCVYNSNSSTYVENNNFDRFSFSIFAGNNRTNINSARFWKKSIVFLNNKLNMDHLKAFDPYGQNIRFIGNTINVSNITGADHYYYDPFPTGSISFDGNTIGTLTNPSKICLNGESMTSCNLESNGSTEFEIYSPCYCSGVKCKNSRLSFHPGLEKTEVKGIIAEHSDWQINIAFNGTRESKVIISDSKFTSRLNNTAPQLNFYFKYENPQAITRSPHTCDIYFENITFEDNRYSRVGNYCTVTNSISGDSIRLHFINCKFEIGNFSFANSSILSVAECRNCIFDGTVTFNGSELQNN